VLGSRAVKELSYGTYTDCPRRVTFQRSREFKRMKYKDLALGTKIAKV
jgi:hypothetical protein